MGEDLETSRTAMEDQLGTGLDNVFPEDSGQTIAAARNETSPAALRMGGRRFRRREHGDYNLEAFVSAETTLAGHLAEQLSLAITDPARRMIGQYLIDMVDEAGYLTGDLQTVARSSAHPWPRSKPCSPSCRASIRPASVRAISPNA